MRVWRVCQRRYARTAMSGEGARRHGGRWHHAGTPVVYTSETLSLAALELLVHFDMDLAPRDFVSIPVDIPDGVTVRRLPTKKLPRGWNAIPAPRATRQIGADWLRGGRTLALAVPSVLVPEESNVLVNPAHADFRRLRIGPPRPFRFDPRLARR